LSTPLTLLGTGAAPGKTADGRALPAAGSNCLDAYLGCQLSGDEFPSLTVAGRPLSDIHFAELIATKRTFARR
jgi:hypothetical protein